MEESKIRWTGSTWNPMTGCTKISPGCKNCYALLVTQKFPRGFPNGFVPTFKPERLSLPRKWREPRKIFVNSMSDLFHEDFTDEQIDQVFDVMCRESRHTYQVLTKRPERMRDYVRSWLSGSWRREVPPQIWLGTSIERDDYAWRVDVLREIPVPVKFLSLEPLLGPLPSLDLAGISWAIVGGESGPGYRPMDHEWAREILAKARASGTAFFFKQSAAIRTEMGIELDGERYEEYPVTPAATAASEPAWRLRA